MSPPRMSLEELVEQLGDLGSSSIVTQALQLAERGHRDQTRIGGGSVLEEHIYPMCFLVLGRSADISGGRLESRLAAALCHDLLEDTTVSLQEIRRIDGGLVSELVEILTDTDKTPADYFRDIQANPDALVIKVCDRLNNLQCAHKITDRKELLRFCEETVQYVFPMITQSLALEDAVTMKRLLAQLRSIASA